MRDVAWWLPRATPLLQRSIVERAIRDLGMLEDPPGSNRGPDIDLLNSRAGVPLGSYWCAAWAGAVWQDAGAEVPHGYASCDAWMTWAKMTNRWTLHTPAPGACVLYGVPGDARHIGVVIRTAPLVLSVEGNTTVGGPTFERNGVAVALKLVGPKSPVLGYCHPLPFPPGAALAA